MAAVRVRPSLCTVAYQYQQAAEVNYEVGRNPGLLFTISDQELTDTAASRERSCCFTLIARAALTVPPAERAPEP